MNALLPPLDLPLNLNPTASPSRPRPVIPFSLLIDYVGPLSPVSWSRPASPSSPHHPSAPHVHDVARRPRSRSRSLLSRTRPPSFVYALATPTSSPASPPSSPSLTSSRHAASSTSTTLAADESQKVVKVIASHGRTGDQCELSYSSSKVVGNGSFGVVFQAKLAAGSLGPDNEGDDDVAIKKVLQDKRFKVRQ